MNSISIYRKQYSDKVISIWAMLPNIILWVDIDDLDIKDVQNGVFPSVQIRAKFFTKKQDWKTEIARLTADGFEPLAIHEVPEIVGLAAKNRSFILDLLGHLHMGRQVLREVSSPEWTLNDVALDLAVGSNSLYGLMLKNQDRDWSQHPDAETIPEVLIAMIETLSRYSKLIEDLAPKFPTSNPQA